jgi:cytochrome b involved in lipid metabolism
MGWLKALHDNTFFPKSKQIQLPYHPHVEPKSAIQEISHIEDISIPSNASPATSRSPLSVSPDTPDIKLPFLSAAELVSCPEDRLYIVVENIVYDCTQFVEDHPGGRQVIESFRGQDCSWQFWRFHSEDTMRVWGRPLRVARTKGVKNKWKEMPRYVGLKSLSAAGEDNW